MADEPKPGLLDRAKTAIGGLLYDSDRGNPDAPHVDFSGGEDKVPKQIVVDGKLVRADAKQAAEIVGAPTDLTGPNADEARDYLTKTRINAGLRPKDSLPPVYERMAKARAAGFSWDDINSNMAERRQRAYDAGYTPDEVNAHLLGVPIANDPKPNPPSGSWLIDLAHKVQGGANIPAEVSTGLRDFSDKWFGPHDPFKAQNLPTPGAEYTTGGLLARTGWNVVDFAKTFPAAIVNGAGATAEMFDGKDKNAYEWTKLGYEAAGFWAMFLPLKKGAAPLPHPQEILDTATEIAQRHPDGLNEATIAQAQKRVGAEYVATKAPPAEPPAQMDLFPPIKEGEGAKPLDPAMAAMRDLNATDKIMGPKDTGPKPNLGFKELMADETGAIPLRPRIDIQPETLFQRDPEVASGAIHDWLALTTPFSLAPRAGEAISAKLSQNAVEAERSVGTLVRFGRAVGELSTATRLKLIDDIETGNLGRGLTAKETDAEIAKAVAGLRIAERPGGVRTPEARELAIAEARAELLRVTSAASNPYDGTVLGAFAKQLRTELDKWHTRITEAGGEVGYVEDYLPHIYANPDMAAQWLRTHSPIAGAKSFTKDRIFGTYAAAREAGLQMASDNPIHLATVSIQSMQRYAAALQIVKDFKAQDLLVAVKAEETAPADFVPISGRLGVTEEGMLYAPKDTALLINNITDKGLARFSLYRLLRSASNAQIQMQLGLSGFHAMFILQDAITSSVALGMQQISRAFLTKPSLATLAEVPRGLLTMAKAPLAPFEAGLVGRQIINDLLGTKKGVGDVPILSDAFREGGGRLGITEDYRGSAYGNFLNAFKGTFNPASGYATIGQELSDMWRNAQNMRAFGHEIPASYVSKFAFQFLGRFMETAAAPIMAGLVPTIKTGMFGIAMRDALRVAPEMGPLEIRHVANVTLKSMDNRMGEMVYDNRFWNKTVKDLAHLSVRALGWNAGDIAELPGGALDIATLKRATIGDMNQITTRASYVPAMVATTALMGATIGYMTGNPPEELIDYIFPQTPWGRINLPGYAKDLYKTYTDPLGTAKSKLNPMFGMVNSMLTNRDWYGAAIADPHEDMIENVQDYAEWFGRQYMPITVQQLQHPTPEQAEIPEALRWLGVNPAPYEARNPGGAAKFQAREEKGALRKRARERAE